MGTKMPLPIRWHTGSEILDTRQFVDELGQPRRFVRVDLPAGAARFAEAVDGQPYLTFVCPCGCATVGSLALAPFPGCKGWDWDGDRVFPTLRPAITRKHCGWHGWLVAGVWQSEPPPEL